MVSRFIDSPAFRLSERINSQLNPLANNPLLRLYNGSAFQRFEKLQQRYSAIVPALRNEAYFQALAQQWQTIELWSHEFQAELAEIETSVKPTVTTYNAKIKGKYGIDVEACLREFLIQIYLHIGVDDLRHMLPEDVSKALIRFALDKSSEFDKLMNEVESTLKIVASDKLANASPLLTLPSATSTKHASPSTLAELIPSDETRQFVIQAMKELHITDQMGNYQLPPKQKVRLLALIHVCRDLSIFNYHSDELSFRLFCEHINVKYTKLDTRSVVYKNAFKHYKSYIAQRIPETRKY